MMSSRRAEEKNERIIRGLMKLPPNRRCINCNSVGPQFVCTNFWTFVCLTCSGIHREFTHRVKSVSMAKFTTEEVEALQKGGNQHARDIYLRSWDMQRMRLPDNSNADKIRDFIRNVYIDKKYTGGSAVEKPQGDVEGFKSSDNDLRRPSSYHSYSQSPPYDYQYEERRYGKNVVMLSQKPGSDRTLADGRSVSFVYSPGRKQMLEERFANESSSSRFSDFSSSSPSEPYRYGAPSPSSQDEGYSPNTHQSRNTLTRFPSASVQLESEGIRHYQRTSSSGSFGSFDSNSISLRSFDSSSMSDATVERTMSHSAVEQTWPALPRQLSHSSVQRTGVQQKVSFVPPLTTSKSSSTEIQKPVATPAPQTLPPAVTHDVQNSIDLFADITSEPSSVIPLSTDVGWATFDPQHKAAATPETIGHTTALPNTENGATKASAFTPLISVTVGALGYATTMATQELAGTQDLNISAASMGSPSWNAFGDQKPPIAEPVSSLPVDPYSRILCDQVGLEKQISPELNSTSGGMFIPLNCDGISEGVVPCRPVVKSTNPFDIHYESELEADTGFLDMSSFRGALPSANMQPSYSSNVPQPWFHQNPAAVHRPSIPTGRSMYVGAQFPNPQMQDLMQGAPLEPLGRNPFA